MLGDQADLQLFLRLDANNGNRECAFAVGGHPAGFDAQRGSDDLRLGQGVLHRRLVVCQWQQRHLIRFITVTKGMDLDISTQYFNGIRVNGLVEPGYKAIVEHHQGQG